jgi:G2/mitotic-specific cyclin 2
MLIYLHGPVAHEAFFKKYASKKFLKGEAMPHTLSFLTLTNLTASIISRKWAKDMYAFQQNGGGVAVGDI